MWDQFPCDVSDSGYDHISKYTIYSLCSVCWNFGNCLSRIYLIFLLFHCCWFFFVKHLLLWRNSPNTNSWSYIFTHLLFGNHLRSRFSSPISLCTIVVGVVVVEKNNRERVRLFCIPCVKIFPVNFVCILIESCEMVLLKGHTEMTLYACFLFNTSLSPTQTTAIYSIQYSICACSIAVVLSQRITMPQAAFLLSFTECF